MAIGPCITQTLGMNYTTPTIRKSCGRTNLRYAVDSTVDNGDVDIRLMRLVNEEMKAQSLNKPIQEALPIKICFRTRLHWDDVYPFLNSRTSAKYHICSYHPTN